MDVTLIVVLACAVIAGAVLIATHEAELRALERWDDDMKTPPTPTPTPTPTSIHRVK